MDIVDVRDAVAGIGGGVGRVELAGEERALRKPALDFAGVDVVREVAGHQRCEDDTRLKRGEDALSISRRGRGGGDRRIEIGHNDGPRERTTGIVGDRGEHGAVAKMDMPVIGRRSVRRLSYGRPDVCSLTGLSEVVIIGSLLARLGIRRQPDLANRMVGGARSISMILHAHDRAGGDRRTRSGRMGSGPLTESSGHSCRRVGAEQLSFSRQRPGSCLDRPTHHPPVATRHANRQLVTITAVAQDLP